MKKEMIGVGGAILCLILSAAAGIAQETPRAFTLKLGGGAGSLSGGDLTSFKNGANESPAGYRRPCRGGDVRSARKREVGLRTRGGACL